MVVSVAQNAETNAFVEWNSFEIVLFQELSCFLRGLIRANLLCHRRKPSRNSIHFLQYIGVNISQGAQATDKIGQKDRSPNPSLTGCFGPEDASAHNKVWNVDALRNPNSRTRRSPGGAPAPLTKMEFQSTLLRLLFSQL